MRLTEEQAYRLATMIKPSDVLEYINNHLSDYEEWLKEEKRKEKVQKEVQKNEIKIFETKRKQATND